MEERMNNENLKQKILNVATQEFANLGFNEASTNVICKKANVSKGLLYHHYNSKKEIYITVVRNAIDSFKENVKFNSCTKQTGIDCINKYFNCKFRFFGENPLYSKIITAVVINDDFDEIKAMASEFHDYNNSIIYEIIKNIDFNTKFQIEKAFELIVMIGEKLEEKHMKDIDIKPKEAVIEEFRQSHKLMLEMIFEGIDKKESALK